MNNLFRLLKNFSSTFDWLFAQGNTKKLHEQLRDKQWKKSKQISLMYFDYDFSCFKVFTKGCIAQSFESTKSSEPEIKKTFCPFFPHCLYSKKYKNKKKIHYSSRYTKNVIF